MKPLHVGLILMGAALAGGLAMRLAEPPPIPRSGAPRLVRTVAVNTPRQSAPEPVPVSAAPPQVEAQAQTVSPAPPAVYSEPPHVGPSVRRKPFGENTIASVGPPALRTSEPVHVAPPMPPAEYKNPAVVVPAIENEPAPEPPVSDTVRGEPSHVAPAPRQVALAPGTLITVRLLETLSTERASEGDLFQATLADPLISDGLIVAERGARVTGRITAVKRAGRFAGESSLELRLVDVTTADGQRIALSSDPWLKRSSAIGRGSAAKIGGGAALGAVIGAMAGGGLGAVVGAGAGGGAGAGMAALSGAKPVTIATETVIQFRLASLVKITERQL